MPLPFDRHEDLAVGASLPEVTGLRTLAGSGAQELDLPEPLSQVLASLRIGLPDAPSRQLLRQLADELVGHR